MTDAGHSRLERLRRALGQPVDAAGLAAFRILFGAVMFTGLCRYLLSGWAGIQYEQPRFFFKYLGFEWVGHTPGWPLYLHLGALAALALCIGVGLFYRGAAALFCVGFAWFQLLDVTNYLNHYYFVVLMAGLLALVPANRLWSLDAWRRPGLRRETVPAWAPNLLRFQVAVLYVNAGLAKLTADWLLHAQPLRIWMAARTETPLIGPLLDEAWLAYGMSWAGFLFDTTIVGWLSWRRSRPFAYAAVLTFHFFTHVFFDIGMFPFIMVVSALVFFPAEWPRRAWAWVSARVRGGRAVRRERSRSEGQGSAAAPFGSAPGELQVARWRWGAGLVAFGLYALFQVGFPLRHLVYPGDVLWNEEGMRFSWKVLVREKNGSVTFHVRSKATGKRWQVNPRRYLEWRQVNEMSSQPDLILQLAHHIADDFRARGVGEVEVRAEAWVSLNGRKAQLMIDPQVDLAAIEDGLSPKPWILPGPTEPPLGGERAVRFAAGSAPVEER